MNRITVTEKESELKFNAKYYKKIMKIITLHADNCFHRKRCQNVF